MRIADIVIPHHNRHDRLKECLENIDNSLFYIHIESGGSFAENCNRGAEKAITDNIIILNDDTIPNNEDLKNLCDIKADIVGVAQKIPTANDVFYGIKFINTKKHELKGDYATEINKAVIPCGVCFLAKKKAWRKLKGFDERFINGGEDSDFGIRALKEGMDIKFYQTPIHHYHSQSEGRLRYSKENQVLLNKLWNNNKTRKMLLKKRVLVTNNHLDRFGGSETFVYSMVKELERLGYKVDVLTLTTEIKGMALELKDNLIETPEDSYDIILINHNTCLEKIRNVTGYKVFTSHGIYPKIEQPIGGGDKYIAISEEVKQHMENLGFKSELIVNGIDCERFKPKKQIRVKPKKVLSLCQGEEANFMIKKACKKLKLELVVFQELNERIFDIEKHISDTDIVFTLGRGVYEAMACGRDVIIYDSRSYQVDSSLADGRVTKDNFKELVKNNCSGRRYMKKWDVDDIIEEIKGYKKKNGDDNREIALKELNIKDKVNQYIK